MNRMQWFRLVMLLAFTTLVPSRASAQTVLPEQQCVSSFLAACATLQFIDFSETWEGGTKGILRLIVSNSSNDANSYIDQLIFDFSGILPGLEAYAVAEYGEYSGGVFTKNGEKENWKVELAKKGKKGEKGKGPKGLPEFQIDLSVKDDAKDKDGGNKGLRAYAGDAVMIEIKFTDLLTGVELGCDDPVDCQAWSAEMKGWGGDGKGKGFTTPISTPEPTTIILLATGLAAMAGAARRRRGDNRSE